MKKFKHQEKTMEALEKQRVRTFAFFDFVNQPLRIYYGIDDIALTVEWDDHSWIGVEKYLLQYVENNPSVFGGFQSQRGQVTAAVPVSKIHKTVLDTNLYQNRKIELFTCALTPEGDVIEQIDYGCGTIVSLDKNEGIAIFKATDMRI